MARKDLFKGLIGNPAGGLGGGVPPLPPRAAKGAIGAVGQSIAELRNRSVVEVPADQIDAAGILDRLDDDPDGIAALADSIRSYGQQVPVLLRHSPNDEGRYEVVYGRRRVAALKLAGLPVKAMLRELNDRDVVIAQGQENTARKDLSFIEKANFARQMRDTGFDRAVICDALAIDKTLVSRMLSVADAIPLPLLFAIGAAPSIGRDRWLLLAERIGQGDAAALVPLARGATSDERFEAVLRATAPARPERAGPPALLGHGGVTVGQVARKPNSTVLTLNRAASPGFDDWLLSRMADLHRQFLDSQESQKDQS